MVRAGVSIALIAGFLLLSRFALHGRCASDPWETQRIQAHLERVEDEIRARDVAHLSAAQRAARTQHLDDLRAYRLSGRFPHNHESAERTPVFIDRHGTRCAMAHLIERSGGGDLVRRVAASQNLARIHHLADDPELLAWLDREGITLAEAARIQPEYGGGGIEVVSGNSEALYAAGTMVASIFSIAGIAMAEKEHPATSTWNKRDGGRFALAAGIVSLGLGVPGLVAVEDDYRPWGALNVMLGAFATMVGVTTLRDIDDSPTPSVVTNTNRVTFAAAPYVERAGAGGMFVLRF